MDDNPEVIRHIQVETSMIDIYKEKRTCFLQYLNPVLHFLLSFSRECLQSSLRPKGFYKAKCMADTCDGGFGELTEDFLRRSEESLQQGPPICFTAFSWVHHVNKLLGGSLEVV
jgi:hypothetical protein